MARVDIERLDKVYPGGSVALRGVDLAIADGELLVLVGPSGCGKSTLLRILAGLEDITDGTLRIDGRVANDASPQERNVAMVFQDYALYPHLSVRGNLEFPLKMRGMPPAERHQRAHATAALLGLSELLDRFPKALSGGQRQRVAMGRALVREPAVFLLDEPLSNLDAKLRVQVRAEIAQLQWRTGTTMIYVTHDQVEAMTLGDRVAVLDRGVLQQVGAPSDLYAAPANVFVASFIGTPPMNLLPARLADDRVLAIDGGVRRVLPEALRAALPGGHATAGVRPEALRLVADGTADAWSAVVTQMEQLGHETLVHSDVDGHHLIVRLEGMAHFAVGTRLFLQPVPDAVCVFDAAGLRLGVC